jgi:flavin-dependent dehydrogenase
VTADYDVVVVGASIAGCTAATLLGRAGLRVAVVEQRPDPAAYKTVCTHLIQPSATPTIERLGLAQRIESARSPARLSRPRPHVPACAWRFVTGIRAACRARSSTACTTTWMRARVAPC